MFLGWIVVLGVQHGGLEAPAAGGMMLRFRLSIYIGHIALYERIYFDLQQRSIWVFLSELEGES